MWIGTDILQSAIVIELKKDCLVNPNFVQRASPVM